MSFFFLRERERERSVNWMNACTLLHYGTGYDADDGHLSPHVTLDDCSKAQGMNLFDLAETHCNNVDRSESIRMITRSPTFSSLTQGAALWLQLSHTNWPFFWCLENVAGWLGPVNVDELAERRVSNLTCEQMNTFSIYNNTGRSKIQVIARIKKLK